MPMQVILVPFLGLEDPLEKGMDIDKEPQGQSRLVGYSPWGRQELDPTEELTHRDLEGLFCSFLFIRKNNWPEI